MPRKVTLADVSNAAHVGLATASRALAADLHPDINDETRARVRKIADELGYRPSLTARALRTGAYRAISILVPDDEWGWWERTIRAMTETAADAGYQVLVHAVGGRLGGAASVVESLANVPTEGAIVCGSAGDVAMRDAAARIRMPIVAIDDSSLAVVVPTIAVDGEAGAYEAVRHLIDGGRRRIAYVGAGIGAISAHRLAGYHRALREAGRDLNPDLEVVCAHPADISVTRRREVEELLERHPDVDGVFCEFDLIAAGVLRAIKRAGRSVPGDVGVVGFDDDQAAQLVDPPLTTMRQPYRLLGSSAVASLLQVVRGEELSAERWLLPPALVVRASSTTSA